MFFVKCWGLFKNLRFRNDCYYYHTRTHTHILTNFKLSCTLTNSPILFFVKRWGLFKKLRFRNDCYYHHHQKKHWHTHTDPNPSQYQSSDTYRSCCFFKYRSFWSSSLRLMSAVCRMAWVWATSSCGLGTRCSTGDRIPDVVWNTGHGKPQANDYTCQRISISEATGHTVLYINPEDKKQIKTKDITPDAV